MISSFYKLFLEINKPLLYSQYRKTIPEAPDAEIDEIINLVSNADPTPNKKYVPWIFREYLQKRIRLPEDNPVVLDNLKFFDENKFLFRRLGKSLDITTYNRNDLWTVLEELRQSGLKSKRKETINIKKEGAEKIYEDDEYLIIKMTKGEACSYYARGTKWCTTDSATAERYLEEGPIYIIYKDGVVYAQFHVETKQLMDTSDIPISPDQIPNKLKDIIKQYIPYQEGDKNLFKRNSLFGIPTVIKNYSNGYSFQVPAESDPDDIVLPLVLKDEKDNSILRMVINNGGLIAIKHGVDINVKFNKTDDFETFKSQIYPLKKYNKYILDILEKPEYIRFIYFFNNSDRDWKISDLSSEEKEELFSKRPDLFPKVFLKTKAGNLWIQSLNKEIDENSFNAGLLNKDLQNIISVTVTKNKDYNTNMLGYTTWQTVGNFYSLLNNEKIKPINKEEYSPDITEFIIKYNIEVLDNSYNYHDSFNFKQLTEKDQKVILNIFPYFDDMIGFVLSKINDKKDLVKELNHRFRLYNIKYFDDKYLIPNEYDTVKFSELDFGRGAFSTKFFNIENLFSFKSNVIPYIDMGVGAYLKGKEVEKPNYLDNLGLDDPEIIRLSKTLGNASYYLDSILQKSYLENFKKKAANLFYSYIFNFENNKFKIVLKDQNIYILTTYEYFLSKRENNWEQFKQEYEDFIKNIKEKFPVKEFLHKLKEIPSKIDMGKFRELIEKKRDY